MIHIDNVSDQLKTIPLACVDLATMEQADGALSDLHHGIFPWFRNINPQALQKWL